MIKSESERRLYGAAFLYTITGGYLDAFCYVLHGHVFANAQTGNFVLLGLDLAGGNLRSALGHLPPILTFAAGVLGTLWLHERRSLLPAQLRTVGACIEITVLTALFFLGSRIPNSLVVPSIALVAAVQVTSFQAVSRWKFNSVMTTGNLRATLNAFVLWRAGKDPEQNRSNFLATGATCFFFGFGALLGGLCSRFFPRGALLPCILAITAAAVLGKAS